jgi:hypothetical protein
LGTPLGFSAALAQMKAIASVVTATPPRLRLCFLPLPPAPPPSPSPLPSTPPPPSPARAWPVAAAAASSPCVVRSAIRRPPPCGPSADPGEHAAAATAAAVAAARPAPAPMPGPRQLWPCFEARPPVCCMAAPVGDDAPDAWHDPRSEDRSPLAGPPACAPWRRCRSWDGSAAAAMAAAMAAMAEVPVLAPEPPGGGVTADKGTRREPRAPHPDVLVVDTWTGPELSLWLEWLGWLVGWRAWAGSQRPGYGTLLTSAQPPYHPPFAPRNHLPLLPSPLAHWRTHTSVSSALRRVHLPNTESARRHGASDMPRERKSAAIWDEISCAARHDTASGRVTGNWRGVNP